MPIKHLGTVSLGLSVLSVKGIGFLTKRRLSDHKIGVPLGFAFFITYCKLLALKPVPLKMYTSIFTDTSESGRYVRKTVKKRSPQVWKNVSEQLHSLGYNFPEMNEMVSGEFPTALLNAYEASS